MERKEEIMIGMIGGENGRGKSQRENVGPQL